MKPGVWASGAAVTAIGSACLALGLAPGLACLAQTPGGSPASGSQAAVRPLSDPQQDIQASRAQVRQNPADPKARYALAEALKRAGRYQEAAAEYLRSTEIEPAFYIAYHQLSTINAEPAQLDEAISRLTRVKEEKPRDLMLRVALSELLEKRSKYYQGARVLVDLVYQNAVPDKYLARVNARIHYLLVKSKDSQESEKGAFAEEELDTLPPPLPESSLHRDLAASRLKESRIMRGVGNTRLLP